MAKSLRSKIKRKFRAELAQRVGKPHVEKQEATIQENLKKALEKQGGSSLESLKERINAKPVANKENATMEVEDESGHMVTEVATKEDADSETKTVSSVQVKKPTAGKKKKSKFVRMYSNRKKGLK